MTWSILHGDAIEVMASLEPASVDAVCTDPPYGERVATWDGPRSREWHEAWVSAVHRVLKPHAALITFASRRYLDILMGAVRTVRGDSSACPLQSGAWIHRQGFMAAEGFLRPEHEPFIVSGKVRAAADDVRRARVYSKNWSGEGPVRRLNRIPGRIGGSRADRAERAVDARGFAPFTWEPSAHGPVGGTTFEAARNIGAERVDHPSQKPESVMAYLVALACPPRGVVLDPFGGSFTTAVVAVRSGRSFVGCDSSAEYCEIGRRRLVQDAPLFNQPQASDVEADDEPRKA